MSEDTQWFLGPLWTIDDTPPTVGFHFLGDPRTYVRPIPSGQEDYHFVCIPHRIEEDPWDFGDIGFTRIYLIERRELYPVVVQILSIPFPLRGVSELSDGSYLLVGNRRIQRLVLSGNRLSLRSSIEWSSYPRREDVGDFQSENPYDEFIFMPGDHFYRFTFREYISTYGAHGWAQHWATRFQYNLSSDTLTTTVPSHYYTDSRDYTTDYFNAVDNPHPGISADFQNGYLGLGIRWNWRRSSSAHSPMRLLVHGINSDGTLFHQNDGGYLCGTASFLSSTRADHYWDGGDGILYAAYFRTTSHPRPSHRYRAHTYDPVSDTLVVASNSDSTSSLKDGMYFSRAFRSGEFAYLDQYNEHWCLMHRVLDFSKEEFTEGDQGSFYFTDDIEGYSTGSTRDEVEVRTTEVPTAHGQISDRLTLVTFGDYSGSRKLRHFRYIYAQGVDVPPLDIPRKQWAYANEAELEELMRQTGVPEEKRREWLPVLMEWSEQRGTRDYANYREIETWVESLRRG